METVTAWNKREDIDILEVHILCEWWCDIGYPDGPWWCWHVMLACGLSVCSGPTTGVMWLGRGVAKRLRLMAVGWVSSGCHLPVEWRLQGCGGCRCWSADVLGRVSLGRTNGGGQNPCDWAKLSAGGCNIEPKCVASPQAMVFYVHLLGTCPVGSSGALPPAKTVVSTGR